MNSETINSKKSKHSKSRDKSRGGEQEMIPVSSPKESKKENNFVRPPQINTVNNNIKKG